MGRNCKRGTEQVNSWKIIVISTLLVCSFFSTFTIGEKTDSSAYQSDIIPVSEKSTQRLSVSQNSLESYATDEKPTMNAYSTISLHPGMDEDETGNEKDTQGVFASPTWPTSWTLFDTDPTEDGTSDDYKDVHYAYYAVDTDYLYFRLECYGYPNFALEPDARYKIFIDTDCPHNMVASGGRIYEAGYILMVEDTNNNQIGDMYLPTDVDNDGDFSEYSPWASQHPAPITDTLQAGYSIAGHNVDLYVSRSSIGNPDCLYFTWATDNEDPTIDQTSISDRSDHFFDGTYKNADLSIEKHDNSDPINAGELLTYALHVTNLGPNTATSVTITDTLPSSVAFISATPTPSSGSFPTYHWTISSLNVGQTLTITISVLVNNGTSGIISNIASVSSSINDPFPSNNQDSEDTTVMNPLSNIFIEKSPHDQQVVVGDTATFTITVINTGDTVLTNVVVSDPLCPDCDVTIGTLAVGASYSYTCSCVATQDFTNIATVSGWYGTHQITAVDTAIVDVISPSIYIAKSPNEQQVMEGETATFSVTVINTGDMTLNNVVVSDPLCPDCDVIIGTLSGGASHTYECSCVALGEDFINIATVSGWYGIYEVIASDTARVDIISPDISIEKSPDFQQVINGQTAIFSITVTNTGDVDFNDIVVSDPLCPSCNEVINFLGVDESYTYSCSCVATVDFTNVVTVSAWYGAIEFTDSDVASVDVISPAISISKSPDFQEVIIGETATFSITVTNTCDTVLTNVVVSDPLCPDCNINIGTLGIGTSYTYECSYVAVENDFINTAIVSGWSGPYEVTAVDTAFVDVIVPSISIEKSPHDQFIVIGEAATFSITVVNTGDMALANVVVSDPLCPNCNENIGTLGIGASYTYECTDGDVEVDFTNIATVSGWYGTYQVTDSDAAQVKVLNPSISLVKSPHEQQVIVGETATFSITVINTCDVVLTNVVVSDPLCPTCDEVIGTLGIGDSYTYTCSCVPTEDFTNIATVSAWYSTYHVAASDAASVDVVSPSVFLAKSPNDQEVIVGGSATFSITVINDGDIPLTNVVVSDPLCSACGVTIGTLDAGASYTYECSCIATEDFTNVATVSGWYGTAEVTASDTATVFVISPQLSIEKSPEEQQVIKGETATFSITVTNTCNSVLTNVVVSDPLCPDCDELIGTLNVGASYTYSCSCVVGSDDFTNIATVSGWYGTYEVTSTDTAYVDVLVPSIAIEKSPDSQQVIMGETVTFFIEVTNTGDAELTNVVVSDLSCPDCNENIGTLSVGEAVSYACTSVANEDFTNVATVNGVAGTYEVAASDTAYVDVLTPNISLAKSPDSQEVFTGGTATFSILVVNTGETSLTNVVVSDPLCTDCSFTIGILDAGASYSYDCSGVVTSDFTNIATVSGQYGVNKVVTASDSAVVNVVSPSISIEKSPDSQEVIIGQTATFSITVTNTGDTILHNIGVSDPLCSECTINIGTLNTSESYTVTCDCIAMEDFTNIATVSGWYETFEATDSDTASVIVIGPAINITKSPDMQDVIVGGVATFTITVTNTGNRILSNVEVSDSLCPECNEFIGLLGIGASYSYTCSCIATDDFTNVAVVTGWYGMNEVTASDTAIVHVIGPGIAIEKSPDSQVVIIGQTATFTITVTNTGDTALTNVVVSDPLCPACTVTIGLLDIGASYSYNCSSVVTEDFTNIATVSGWYGSHEVTAYDGASVDVLTPHIDVEKYVWDDQNSTWVQELRVPEGLDLPFKIIVRNIGEVALTNVKINDELSSQLDYIANSANITPTSSDTHHINWTLVTLPIGASTEFTFEARTVHLCYGWNAVTVTANENNVSDWELVPVKVISEGQPLVDITKTVWDEHTQQWVDFLYCFKDEILTFKITVGSTSLETLDISVIDMLPMQFEYRDNATPTEASVSPDLRTILWDITIDPGEMMVIQYQAEAVHRCQATNIAIVNVSGCEVDMDSVLVKVFDDTSEFPPIIQLMSPEDGDVLHGVETIRWYAIDDDLLGEDLPIYLYYSHDNVHWMQVGDVHCNNIDMNHGSYDWNTNTIASGKYTLLAEAYTGLVGYESISVFIENEPGTKIDTSIRDVSTGSTQYVRNGDTVQIQAALTGVWTEDLTREDITADLGGFNRGICIANSFNGFVATWMLYNVECTPTNGVITIALYAGEYQSTTVTITADNECPSLSIVKPAKGLYFFNSKLPLMKRTIIFGSITIQIETDDKYGIERAEFYIDGHLEYALTEGPMEWYTNLPRGKHALDVKVYDHAGNYASSGIQLLKYL